MISKKLKTQDDINAAIERAEKAKEALQARIDELKEWKPALFEQWVPEEGDTYLYIDAMSNLRSVIFVHHYADNLRLRDHNVFKPKDCAKVELLAERQRLDRKIMQYVDPFVDGEKNYIFLFWEGQLIKDIHRNGQCSPYTFSTPEKRDAVLALFTEEELKLLLTGSKLDENN